MRLRPTWLGGVGPQPTFSAVGPSLVPPIQMGLACGPGSWEATCGQTRCQEKELKNKVDESDFSQLAEDRVPGPRPLIPEFLETRHLRDISDCPAGLELLGAGR